MRPWGMSMEREVLPQPDEPATTVRPATLVWAFVGTVVLVGWFFLAWLRFGHSAVEAAGESAGSAFALLLIISVVGALRRQDR